MLTHGAAVRPAHAAEERRVADGLRERRIAKGLGGLSNGLHQRSVRMVVRRGRVALVRMIVLRQRARRPAAHDDGGDDHRSCDCLCDLSASHDVNLLRFGVALLRPMCQKLSNTHLASPGRTPGLRRGFSVCGACVRIKSGLREQALVLLERAFEHGRGKRDWIEHDTDYDTLRGDPRFERLLAKLK